MLLVEKLLGSSSAAPTYIEDVFSTYLYTGNGSTQTITNGIDLSTKGGMVWAKRRDAAANHVINDTARGASQTIYPNLTNAQQNDSPNGISFNTNGFTVGGLTSINTNTAPNVSWTFRKQAKFFDVVTFTSNASRGATFSHNLGSSPGCVIIKCTSATENWWVWHRTFSSTQYMALNDTFAVVTGTKTITVSSTQVTLQDLWLNNANATYVAYLFAHDAGGFGAAGTDNVISCGSYTGTGTSGNFVSLGYEPQWLLIKRTDAAPYNWFLLDNMRGIATGSGNDLYLNPNLSDAEGSSTQIVAASAAGFTLEGPSTGLNASGGTYIYIAIRRGPMKTPTSGTSVFGLNARTGTGANATVTGGQTDDAILVKNRGSAVASLFSSRLTSTGYLVTSSTAAEVAAGTTILQANPWDVMDGVKVGTTSTITNASSNTFINYLFRRAPGFFDVVCYTGTGSARTVSHNLGVAPELIITKSRSTLYNPAWGVYHAALGNTKYLILESTNAADINSAYWNNTSPTASVFTVNTNGAVNANTSTYVAYLFATVAGVSKVGSYTGNGTSQTINCGFTGGARFILIKRTDSTGNWYVWDTARGIVGGNDPYLMLNAINAEITTSNSIGPDSTGFIVAQDTGTNINVNAATYIFLAIA